MKPPWQYYVKYKKYLQEYDHNFLNKIDFYIDKEQKISPAIIRKYKLVIFFYHDPLKQLYPVVYKYAKKIERICDDLNIEMINKPDALSNTSKSVQLQLLSKAGYYAPKFYSFKYWNRLIQNDSVDYPIFIRYDCGHDSLGIGYTEPFFSREALLKSKIWKSKFWGKLEHLDKPIALKWIDTKSTDGYYRKYRVYSIGPSVIKGPMQISRNWFVHNENSEKGEVYQKEIKEFRNTKLSMEEEKFFSGINKVLDLS